MPERFSLLLSYRKKPPKKPPQKCDNKIMRCFHYFSSFPEKNQGLPIGFNPQQNYVYILVSLTKQNLFSLLQLKLTPVYIYWFPLSIIRLCHSVTQPVHNATRLLSLLPLKQSIMPWPPNSPSKNLVFFFKASTHIFFLRSLDVHGATLWSCHSQLSFPTTPHMLMFPRSLINTSSLDYTHSLG